MPPPAITTAAGSPTTNARMRLSFMCRLLLDAGRGAPAGRHTCGPLVWLHRSRLSPLEGRPLRSSHTVGPAAPQSAAFSRGGRQKVSPEEFTDFYAASFRRLVGQLYAMTGDQAESEEAVQEAFVRAWSHRGRLDLLGSPEAYVRTTAWRISVSRWQRARVGRLLLRSQPVPDVTDGPGPDRVALIDALRKVPPEQRRALVLYHLCELTVAQIADETGVPASTVKARLARGRRALAPHLRDSDHNWRITHG